MTRRASLHLFLQEPGKSWSNGQHFLRNTLLENRNIVFPGKDTTYGPSFCYKYALRDELRLGMAFRRCFHVATRCALFFILETYERFAPHGW